MLGEHFVDKHTLVLNCWYNIPTMCILSLLHCILDTSLLKVCEFHFFLFSFFQVMSNDRVIVCNFETAIQTDPNTCLMVLSGGVPPPSNRYGLSPEVLSAFAKLR